MNIALRNENFLTLATRRMHQLCYAAELMDDAPNIVAELAWLSESWHHWPIGDSPRWPSHVSDDQAPFELSLGTSRKGIEVQFYWEAHGEPPSLATNLSAGLLQLDAIAKRHILALDRFLSIRDLFLPDQPAGPFTILFGATWGKGRAPKFKLYLNPLVRGPGETTTLMREAMNRLGFGKAWDAACSKRAQQSATQDELTLLCLDLSTDKNARVKVYRRHYAATVAQLAAFASIARDYEPGDAEQFYGLVADGETGAFKSKPPITSLTFRHGDDDEPGSVTLEFPMSSYVANDHTASERVLRCFEAYGLDSSSYRRALEQKFTRPLAAGKGIHAHVTHRRLDGDSRITVYFASDAYPVDTTSWPTRPADEG